MVILSSGVGNYITFNSRKFSYFAGNDYLGLTHHPEVISAAIRSIEHFGNSFSASRQTTGSSEIHLELEKRLSVFKNEQDSAIFASGYLGNKILLHVLRKEYSAIFMDELAHPSIKDAIPNGFQKVFQYEHCNTDHLEVMLKKNKRFRPLIISDGLFSLSGEIVPLDRISQLAEKYSAMVVIDDAHATGILGENGRGTPEFYNLEESDNIFQTETMSKAMGNYGGFIAGRKKLIDKIRTESFIYQASTSLPPAIVGAGIAAIKVISDQPELRIRLISLAIKLKNSIMELDFQTSKHHTPIIPLFFAAEDDARSLSAFLEKNRLIAPFIKYPVKTSKFMIRITVSANHNEDQIEELLYLLKIWRNKKGIL